MVLDTKHIWDVTEHAEKAANINHPRPPVPLWEEQIVKVPRVWNGRNVIERDVRIGGGVYLFSKDGKTIDEALVVDDDRSPELKTIYNEVKKRTVFESRMRKIPEKNIAFSVIKDVVDEVMPYFGGVVEASDELSDRFIGREMDIGENIRANVGVCRHKALVAGYVIERLIADGVLRGKVSVDRSFNPDTGKGHAWVRYTSLDGKVFVFDPAKNIIGSLQQVMAEKTWDYRRPGEKVSGISFPRMLWWNRTMAVN